MSTLILVRHGQSQWNLENRFTGWVDVPLTQQGEGEAKSAGQLIHKTHVSFHRAFTSNLSRAQKTLDLILKEIKQNPPVERSEKLNERHYGDLQGKNKKETADIYGEEQVHIWRRSYDIPPPGGESLKTCAERVLPYFKLQILPRLMKNENILIVAHGNSLRALIMDLEHLTGEQILKRELATGRPYVYEIQTKNSQLHISQCKELI